MTDLPLSVIEAGLRREWAERIARQFETDAVDAIEEGIQRGATLAADPDWVEMRADLGVKNEKLRYLADKAAAVMSMLEVHGSLIVPHLLDSDDNAGQLLREAIEEARALAARTANETGKGE